MTFWSSVIKHQTEVGDNSLIHGDITKSDKVWSKLSEKPVIMKNIFVKFWLIDTFFFSQVKYYHFKIDISSMHNFYSCLSSPVFIAVLSRYLHWTYQLLLILIHVLLGVNYSLLSCNLSRLGASSIYFFLPKSSTMIPWKLEL